MSMIVLTIQGPHLATHGLGTVLPSEVQTGAYSGGQSQPASEGGRGGREGGRGGEGGREGGRVGGNWFRLEVRIPNQEHMNHKCILQ